MISTERFHELLLDHLYDLLDEADAQSVREYLAAHPEARAEAERVRGMMAAAARCEFPQVRFTPPVEPTPSLPVALSRPVTGRSARGYWLRWAVAACLILGLGAAVRPTARHFVGFQDAKNDAALALANKEQAQRSREELTAARRTDFGSAQGKTAESEKKLSELRFEYASKWHEESQRAANENLYMIVTGPPAIQPGAPNQFE